MSGCYVFQPREQRRSNVKTWFWSATHTVRVCSSIRTCAVYIGASRQCDYDDYDLPSTSWVCLPTLNLSFWQNEAITETLFKIILGEEEGLKIGKDLIFFFVLSGG